jgi:hypothetical protein
MAAVSGDTLTPRNSFGYSRYLCLERLPARQQLFRCYSIYHKEIMINDALSQDQFNMEPNVNGDRRGRDAHAATRLENRFTELLGIEHPIVQDGMRLGLTSLRFWRYAILRCKSQSNANPQ